MAEKHDYVVSASIMVDAVVTANVKAANDEEAKEKAMLDFARGAMTFPFMESSGPVRRLRVKQILGLPRLEGVTPV